MSHENYYLFLENINHVPTNIIEITIKKNTILAI